MSSASSLITSNFEINTALNNLQKYFRVCFACPEHITGVKILADANRHIFGFVTSGAFFDAVEERTLIVALRDEEVVGFLRYHHRKCDLQTTLYDICVSTSERNKNLGRCMLMLLIKDCFNSNREFISLKCPSHLDANIFYEKNGFCCVGSLDGKRQKLNIWRLNLISRGK